MKSFGASGYESMLIVADILHEATVICRVHSIFFAILATFLGIRTAIFFPKHNL